MASKLGTVVSSARRAFVLIDLLAAIAAIGVMICMLLPAIQAAREAARNSQCKNHLREIAFGCLKHEHVHKSFPYSGWSFGWMGDPDQGVGPQQPGSWVYSMGRFMDVVADFDVGAGLAFPLKKAALPALLSTAIREFHCPSRRPAVALPAFSPDGRPCDGGIYLKNSNWPAKVAKSDYAINGGNGSGWNNGAGGTGGAPSESCLRPNGLSSGKPNYPNCNWHLSQFDVPVYWQYFNGVSGWRTAAHARQISDGLSKTVLVGEKFVQPMYYEGGCSAAGSNPSRGNFGDNGSMYIGWDVDIARTGYLKRDQNLQPPDSTFPAQFGGPHANAANFAFCDGSVRSIRYDVADFARFITRNDAASPQQY